MTVLSAPLAQPSREEKKKRSELRRTTLRRWPPYSFPTTTLPPLRNPARSQTKHLSPVPPKPSALRHTKFPPDDQTIPPPVPCYRKPPVPTRTDDVSDRPFHTHSHTTDAVSHRRPPSAFGTEPTIPAALRCAAFPSALQTRPNRTRGSGCQRERASAKGQTRTGGRCADAGDGVQVDGRVRRDEG